MKLIKCPICGKRTTKNRFADSLIADDRNKIIPVKRFSCSHCGGVFGGTTASGKRKMRRFDRRHTK